MVFSLGNVYTLDNKFEINSRYGVELVNFNDIDLIYLIRKYKKIGLKKESINELIDVYNKGFLKILGE